MTWPPNGGKEKKERKHTTRLWTRKTEIHPTTRGLAQRKERTETISWLKERGGGGERRRGKEASGRPVLRKKRKPSPAHRKGVRANGEGGGGKKWEEGRSIVPKGAAVRVFTKGKNRTKKKKDA